MTPEAIADIIDRYNLADIIDRYNLADRDALRRLEAHIRRKLPIRDILDFADYLHGGDFASSSGKWHRGISGYVTQTWQEDAALAELWKGLVRTCYIHLGAASVLGIQDARLVAGYAFADEGDGPTLYDYTLAELVRAVPKEYRKQLDTASRLDVIEKTAVETRQGVGVLVQHLPDADKPPHIEEAEAVAIMKRKGGNMTDRTLRNWLKAGKAGRVKMPISWDNLATVASWSAWVDAYLAAKTTRLTCKSFISSRAGKTQAEKSRRRSPTA